MFSTIFGIGLSTLTRWKRQNHDADLLAGPHDDVGMELSCRRKQNELLRQERAQLRWATVFFGEEASR